MHLPTPASRDLRLFGTVAIGFLYLVQLLFAGRIATWSHGLAVLLAIGIAWTPLLRPVNASFSVVGMILGWINTRLLLGIVFFLVATPLGLLQRVFRGGEIRKQPDSRLATYWTTRTRPSTDFDRQW